MRTIALALWLAVTACTPAQSTDCALAPDCGRYGETGCCDVLGDNCCDPGLELDVDGQCACLSGFPGHNVDGEWAPAHCPSPIK